MPHPPITSAPDGRQTVPPTLDPKQLSRIEAVHRGFLYQHLYAVACLLLAPRTATASVLIERDEDIELELPDRRLYVQVKTRSSPLTYTHIADTLKRFDALRLEHAKGRRPGSASFFVVANTAASRSLTQRLRQTDWPEDVSFHSPDSTVPPDDALPLPQPDLASAFAQCTDLASSLPYGTLAPETLVWKLAGTVQAAAAGERGRPEHAFQTVDLHDLFEQLIIQLQDIPGPPDVYRAQTNEPPLMTDAHVRIVTGHSGSGKTSWISQAARHTPNTICYYDVIDTPGSALSSSLARELAVRMFGTRGGRLGEILLPGATGSEILRVIGNRVAHAGDKITVVLDNAHRVPAPDLHSVIRDGNQFTFLLLCQPGPRVAELEVRTGVNAESLNGWSTDTVALEMAASGCVGDYLACQQLRDLTAGTPLFVQSALAVAFREYDGSVRRLCEAVAAGTHAEHTAQELILTTTLEGLPVVSKDATAVLSLADIPLERSEAAELLKQALGLGERRASVVFRELKSRGLLEIYGGSRIKIHDAVRVLGLSILDNLGHNRRSAARLALKDLLAWSLQKQLELPKLHLYLRVLADVGDVKTLAQFATDELFHELAVGPEILTFLDKAAASEATDPVDRFWALDGLAFAEAKVANYAQASKRHDHMAQLIARHELGVNERLAAAMKRMNLHAAQHDAAGVTAALEEASQLLPDTPKHQRILRYNAAHAMDSLRRFDTAARESSALVQEYYDVLGIGPQHVLGRNPQEIHPLLPDREDVPDDLKHLGDCLDLLAAATQRSGGVAPLARIHAMKFYELANAADSLLRVGQDLVDEFVERNDFVGARGVLEQNLLPNVLRVKVLSRIVPIRSQYAVVLAYCGDFDAAGEEMNRLEAYSDGLDEPGRRELRDQRNLITSIRAQGPPPQWSPVPLPARRQKKSDGMRRARAGLERSTRSATDTSSLHRYQTAMPSLVRSDTQRMVYYMITTIQATVGLFRQALNLPYRIAPERAQELEDLMGPDEWLLRPSHTEANLYAVVPDRAVYVSYACLASLWCLTFAAFHTMHAATRIRDQAEPGETIDFGPYWRDLQLTRYVDYARQLMRGDLTWPDKLELPVPRAHLDSFHGRLNNLFFAALAWLILHELAHIHYIHTPLVGLPTRVRQETHADSFATHWVLDKAGKGLEREFRVLAITLSLSWLLVHEQSKGPGPGDHPPALQRFRESVATFQMSDRSAALESAAYMLKALFDPALVSPKHASASEAFDWVCNRIAFRFTADH